MKPYAQFLLVIATLGLAPATDPAWAQMTGTPARPMPTSIPPPRMPRSLQARDYPRAPRIKKGANVAPPLETIAQKAALLETRADKEVQAGNWPQAEKACQQALELSPSPVRCWALMGLARFNQGNYRGASNALEMAARIDPDDAPTIGWLGVTLARLERKDEAQKWLDVLRARLEGCKVVCGDQAAIQAAIAGVEEALAPKA